MKPNFLEKAGIALYGENWIAPMAKELDVNERSLKRWLSQADIPHGIRSDVVSILTSRLLEITNALVTSLDSE